MIRRILVVDSDESAAAHVSQLVGRPDRPVKVALDGTSALESLIDGNFSLVLLDPRLSDISGLDFMRELAQRRMSVTILVVHRDSDASLASDALALGAYDSIRKPVNPARLSLLVDQALVDRALRDEVEGLRQRLQPRGPHAMLIARGEAMRLAMSRANHAATHRHPLLIWGEEGTGKEAVARYVHETARDRRKGTLVVLPCNALPDTLLDAVLSEKPAEKHAVGPHGGTLVLSEVHELSQTNQAKLSSLLAREQSESQRPPHPITPRIIGLSRIDPATAVASGNLRRDLLAHFEGSIIHLPPLRDRDPENLPLLIDSILERLRSCGFAEKTIAPHALMSLERHPWPGNIAELEHVLERLVVTTPGPVIGLEHLPEYLLESAIDPLLFAFDVERPLAEVVAELTERFESAYLRKALAQNHGRVDHTATYSGLSRRSVSEKLRRYGIDKHEFRRG